MWGWHARCCYWCRRPRRRGEEGERAGGRAPQSVSFLKMAGAVAAAATPVYCVCREPYDVSRFMIECDICKDWFHGR